jgi:hypothetical protein
MVGRDDELGMKKYEERIHAKENTGKKKKKTLHQKRSGPESRYASGMYMYTEKL